MSDRGVGLRSTLAAHPRHVLLGALVAGLLAGPTSAAALATASALVLLAVREAPLVLGALVALLAGAALADVRLAALDRSALVRGDVTERVMLLEHPRTRAFATRVAAARLHGERVLVTAPARVRWPRPLAPGAILAVEVAWRRCARTTTTSGAAARTRCCSPRRSAPPALAVAGCSARWTACASAPNAR
jgi:hypothetical protein